jgi:thiamine-monophosphate kinase
MGEFELIARYFQRPAVRNPLGGGDDCALLAPAPGMQLAVSCDMLVEGRHFLPTMDPARLGHKALAVNLSDLAACGAEPLAFTLALALPQADDGWLAPFARGLLALADEHRCELVGGDTTRGPLNICVTVFGQVPVGQALLRSGARVGDDIYVSGTLGDARLALEVFRGTLALPPEVFEAARRRLELPQPRVALGLALRGIASAAIDISDGLAGDLGHILQQSGVGAGIWAEAVAGLMAAPAGCGTPQQRLDCALAGGDDYELAFTAATAQRDAVAAAARQAQLAVTRIGRIEAEPGLRVLDRDGGVLPRHAASFDHFA